MKYRSPAKLNIMLKAIGRRPDGYHELVSIMIPVNLYDIIELETKKTPGITLSCKGLEIPENHENLAFRAAEAFFSETGLHKNISLKIQKKIPVAAGLGGGSSNAACTLMALNTLLGNPLSFEGLHHLGTRLGADVPFFLYQRPCLATGIGDILSPLEKWEKLWYVIIVPPIKVSTAWAYANLKLKLTKNEYSFIVQRLAKHPLDIAGLMENDLENVTASHFPAIENIKRGLMHAGAAGALMSGSGPSVFGVFESKDQAQWAKRHLSSQNLGEVFFVTG